MDKLNTEWAGKHIKYYDKIDSTNIAAKESPLPHGTLFIAGEQTGGRGRRGRTWQSSPGMGIYMTLLLRPEKLEARYAPRLTQLAAVAVCESLRSLGIYGLVKWPNDVVVDGRKICGILCETVLSGANVSLCAMGIGINYSQLPDDFDESFRDTATSVSISLNGNAPPRESVINAFLMAVENRYNQALIGELLQIYRDMSCTIGQPVRVISPENEWSGVAEDILDDGTLLIRDGNGNKRNVAAGDVSVRGIMGYV